jgi:O-antigen ligase
MLDYVARIWGGFAAHIGHVQRHMSRFLVVGTVVLAPLPDASVELVWIGIWSALLGLAIASANFMPLRSAHWRLSCYIVGFALFYGVIAWIQASPELLPSFVNPAWLDIERLLNAGVSGRITIEAFPPWRAFGLPLCTLLAVLGGLIIGAERKGAWLLFNGAMLAGAAYAALAIAELLMDQGTTLFSGDKPVVSITGPFINRNHAATFFGTVAALWLLRVIRAVERRWESSFEATIPFDLIGAVCGLGLCLVATLLTGSRAGVVITVAVIGTSAALFYFKYSTGYHRWISLGASVLVCVVFLEVFGGVLTSRIGAQGLIDTGRREIYQATISAIRDFPIFGTGLGTFAVIIPTYRAAAEFNRGTWEQAHSTPLELAMEMGCLVAAGAGILWGFVAFRLARGFFVRRRDALLPLGGFSTLLLGSVHSLVDFPLQIPGYTILWGAVIGAGLAQSFSTSSIPSFASRTVVRSVEPARSGTPNRAHED